jgi:hypothetical protein
MSEGKKAFRKSRSIRHATDPFKAEEFPPVGCYAALSGAQFLADVSGTKYEFQLQGSVTPSTMTVPAY